MNNVWKGYGSFVHLLADFEQLAAADVFVGTCSSNVGRLVMLLRDGLGKDESSGISLDLPWGPNRHRRLALYWVSLTCCTHHNTLRASITLGIGKAMYPIGILY